MYNNTCRACLSERGNMFSIFDMVNMEGLIDPPVGMHKILMTCASIEIIEGDGLPEQVCVNCTQEMTRSYLFRKLCEKSNKMLRHHYKSWIAKSKDVTIKKDPYEISENKIFLPETILEEEEEEEDIHKSNVLVTHNYSSNYNRNNTKATEEKLLIEDRKMFVCDICNSEFKSGAGLARHKSAHRLQKRAQQELEERMRLEQHHETERQQLEQQCDQQQQPQQKDQDILVQHDSKSQAINGTVRKRKKKLINCNACNKTFRNENSLKYHQLIHTGEKRHLCNVCGKRFNALSYFKVHMMIHAGKKPHKCPTCDKCFTNSGSLTMHRRTHTGERPFACKICGKGFAQSGYLAAHLRTHTGERPVECTVCHKRFNIRSQLNMHMLIHSKQKQFSCTECGRSFTLKGTLKNHMRIHTGEKPFICAVCGQRFAQVATLASHMKLHDKNSEGE